MNQKGFAPIIVVIIIAAFLVAGGAYWYIHRSTQKEVAQTVPIASSATQESSTSSIIVVASTTPTNTLTPTSPLEEIVSSSSAQVSNYFVVADCYNITGDQIAAVKEIDIFKGGVLVQNIPTKGIAPGSHSCPRVQSQDINFDGYQDFMIDGDYGTGGTSVYYWLYNTKTQQFYCPGGSFFYCSLMNPSFDEASKTISEWDSLSVGETVDWLDLVNGDSINLYQKTDINSEGTSTLTTVSQMEDGKLVVISTSTQPSSQ